MYGPMQVIPVQPRSGLKVIVLLLMVVGALTIGDALLSPGGEAQTPEQGTGAAPAPAAAAPLAPAPAVPQQEPKPETEATKPEMIPVGIDLIAAVQHMRLAALAEQVIWYVVLALGLALACLIGAAGITRSVRGIQEGQRQAESARAARMAEERWLAEARHRERTLARQTEILNRYAEMKVAALKQPVVIVRPNGAAPQPAVNGKEWSDLRTTKAAPAPGSEPVWNKEIDRNATRLRSLQQGRNPERKNLQKATDVPK